ncbi:MAG: hypothetical protein QM680_10650 [Luteolibacter sp.]
MSSIPDASAMLDGTDCTTLSPMQLAALSASREAVENGWQDARRLADLAKNFSRASTAAKALCGLKLRALREHYFGKRNPNGGRPKKTPNRLGFSPDEETPHDLGFSTWAELLADKCRITDQTASNWMRMADAVEELAERESLNLRDIITKLPWDWTLMESITLETAVHKITEGRSQKELLALQSDFMADLGVQPKDRTAGNNPEGKNGGKKKPASTPQQLAQEKQEAARLLLFGSPQPGKTDKGSVAYAILHFNLNEGADLEALPKAELKEFYQYTLQPFAALIRKLADL